MFFLWPFDLSFEIVSWLGSISRDSSWLLKRMRRFNWPTLIPPRQNARPITFRFRRRSLSRRTNRGRKGPAWFCKSYKSTGGFWSDREPQILSSFFRSLSSKFRGRCPGKRCRAWSGRSGKCRGRARCLEPRGPSSSSEDRLLKFNRLITIIWSD